MLPVLFSIGPIAVSSFGFFLALAFLLATFLVWRLARAWDLTEEKILDLILLTFFGGLIGARLFFIAVHHDLFAGVFLKMLLINKYPGLSFWGGVLGGWLTMSLFVRRFKMNFWQVADLASVGLLGGLILGSIGCLLAGCGYGRETDIFGVSVVGVIGKRFPVQAIEAAIFAIVLAKIWPQAIHFHAFGKIVGLSLIWVGIIKFMMEFFRTAALGSHFLSLVLLISGILIFYRTQKRSLGQDLAKLRIFLVRLLTEKEIRYSIMEAAGKNWYNQKVTWSWHLKSLGKYLRRLRVKPTPKNFQ